MPWDGIQFQCAVSTEKIAAVLCREHSHFFPFDIGGVSLCLSQPLDRLTLTLHGRRAIAGLMSRHLVARLRT